MSSHENERFTTHRPCAGMNPDLTAPACTVYMAHRRHFVPTAAFTGVSEKERVYPFENSGRMPVPPFIIHGLPVWVTSRKQPPLAATKKQVEYGLHDSERVMLSPAPYLTGELFRQDGSDFPCHHRNADERIIIFLSNRKVVGGFIINHHCKSSTVF